MFIPETGQVVYVVAKPSNLVKSAQPPTTPLHGAARSLSPTSLAPMSPVPQPMPSRRPLSPAPSYYSRLQQQQGLSQALAGVDLVTGPAPPPPPKDYIRPSLRPPPPDHVPDEAELERRRRGDAQPQLISPRDLDLKFSTSVTGTMPGDTESAETKFLVGSSPLRPSESRSEVSAHEQPLVTDGMSQGGRA
jgi:hypothetical protein